MSQNYSTRQVNQVNREQEDSGAEDSLLQEGGSSDADADDGTYQGNSKVGRNSRVMKMNAT